MYRLFVDAINRLFFNSAVKLLCREEFKYLFVNGLDADDEEVGGVSVDAALLIVVDGRNPP